MRCRTDEAGRAIHHGNAWHSPFEKVPINPYLWCAIGAILGGFAGYVFKGTSPVTRIENMLVGVFGAFAGGEFVAAMIAPGPQQAGVTPLRVALAVAGATALLGLLALMRRAVGPLRSGKTRQRR